MSVFGANYLSGDTRCTEPLAKHHRKRLAADRFIESFLQAVDAQDIGTHLTPFPPGLPRWFRESAA